LVIGLTILLIRHVQQATPYYSPLIWLLPRRNWVWMAHISVFITLRARLASPFPLLSAIGAKTSKIEIGTGVIDMRYENPMYMVEDAGAADLISGGRLQLGISRGSPEQVIEGWRYFGYQPAEGETDAEMGRRKALEFLDKLKGDRFAQPNPYPMFPNPPGLLRLEPHSEGLRERIWWGAASNATAVWAAENGMHLQSSTLKFDESGKPFHIQQAEQIRLYKEAWKKQDISANHGFP
jgi:alkanesulfonate monooxygenase SsuD/methylene tetrahydromethanopterin reductase-like flavin-dependent oxidoreductase (luciferase family)